MILKNSGESFICQFNNKEIEVPHGEFEVEPGLGNFIVSKSHKWGFDVREISKKNKPDVAAIREIVTEGTVAEVEVATPKKSKK